MFDIIFLFMQSFTGKKVVHRKKNHMSQYHMTKLIRSLSLCSQSKILEYIIDDKSCSRLMNICDLCQIYDNIFILVGHQKFTK